MARQRSNARKARNWGSGYQYKFPNFIEPIKLGPFNRLWPLGQRDIPTDALRSLQHGFLKDGVIYPLWGRVEAAVANTVTVGAYELPVLGTLVHFKFWIDKSSGFLKVTRNDGGGDVTVATTLSPADTIKVVAVTWQQALYFSYLGSTSLHKINLATDAYSAIAAGPAGEHLLIVNDQLIAIYKSGDSYIAKWAVNANPEDWAGTGAGQLVIPSNLGEPQALLEWKQEGLLLCLRGGLQISPTGIANPSFRTASRHEITGVRWKYAAVVAGSYAYYFTAGRKLHAYDGAQEIPVGEGERFFEHHPLVYFSQRLRQIVVSSIDEAETLFMDINTRQWVSNLEEGFNWIADRPTTDAHGMLKGYRNEAANVCEEVSFDLEPDSFTNPILKTGYYYIGRTIWIDRIDVVRTQNSSPTPLRLILTRITGENQEDTLVFPAQAAGHPSDKIRTFVYHVNAPVQAFQLEFTLPSTAGSTLGPFVIGSLNAFGNIPFDVTNTLGKRADSNAGGNFVSTGTETEFYATGSMNEFGNFGLLSEADIWDSNIGIEKIVIYGKETIRT